MAARQGASGTGRTDRRLALGAAGERATERWYEAAGYEVLDRNWRSRAGELDLVLTDGRVLVFCEVKTRSGTTFGAPVEAVTVQKQRRIRLLAREWVEARGSRASRQRFDIASVMPTVDGSLAVDVLEDCF